MQPKKKNSYSYEVEKDGPMNVPLRVYASETLMKGIENDRCIDQGRNVASLPGIQTRALMMPDAHQGYGFPIGGVAAFDLKDGIISPGGVGFDINCLPTGTKILTEHGYTKPIESFDIDFQEMETGNERYTLKTLAARTRLSSYDKDAKTRTTKSPSFFMHRTHKGNLITIGAAGQWVSCTPEHPILTKSGMKEAQFITKNDEIAVLPFEGVEHETTDDSKLLKPSYFSEGEWAELEKRGLQNLSRNHVSMPIIAKLFGYLLGDGTLYFSSGKGYVNAYGSREDLEDMKEDIARLGYSANIYERTRAHSIPTRYGTVNFDSTNFELHTSSCSLAKLFYNLGYPAGNKTVVPYMIPEWLIQSPKWLKRLFLSGFFGAELSAPSSMSRTCFYCPTISMNKNREHADSARMFLIQVMEMLDEFGIKTHKLQHRDDFHNKHGETDRLKLLIASTNQNLIRLWSTIGFSYNRKRTTLGMVGTLYLREKERLHQERVRAARRIKELKARGLRLEEVQALIASDSMNARFVERHYYEQGKGQRIALDFPTFTEYAEKKLQEFEREECFYEKVSSIEVLPYEGRVYDFTVPETHTFIAQGIIVSNCGVRVMTTPLTKDDVVPRMREILVELFKAVPCGVGGTSSIRLSDEEMDNVLEQGAEWAVAHEMGFKEDLQRCEEYGRIKYADHKKVSVRAKARGRKQLGTLGAGNHFIEVQVVDKIYNKKVAEKFGITMEGQIVIMFHTGSRGLGHQTCSDFLRLLEDTYPEIMEKLPEKDLIYAPADSKIAMDYFGAMCAAANFAFCNRQIIGNHVRTVFSKMFELDPKDIRVVYDVCHNMAKKEEHLIDGKKKEVYVHRKGATRAFGPGRVEIPEEYRELGQPVLIPGSMGTASWILVGTEKAMLESFGSTAHGAGRTMSRSEANRSWTGEQVKEELEKNNIMIKSASWRGISEEAPKAYKDVDEVVKVSHDAGIAELVARMVPLGVVKG
ncbi:MAG: RtcB family protein [Candidatus Woesearchaeota archaeon]